MKHVKGDCTELDVFCFTQLNIFFPLNCHGLLYYFPKFIFKMKAAEFF